MPTPTDFLKQILRIIGDNKDLVRLYKRLSSKQRLALKESRLVILDFDGVLTDNKVYTASDGTEFVKSDRSDSFGMGILKDCFGVRFHIISQEKNPVVAARAKKLRIPYNQNVKNKGLLLKTIVSRYKSDLLSVCYIGNDINDAECLNLVGFPIVVADAYPSLKKIASYVTQARGGNGAFREVCELMLLAKSGYSLKD